MSLSSNPESQKIVSLSKWLTGNHGNLEVTEKSDSAENLESPEKMTLRL